MRQILCSMALTAVLWLPTESAGRFSPAHQTLAALQTHQPTKSGNVPHIDTQDPMATPNQAKIKTDPAKLAGEAKELADLSQTLPADIDATNHGLLPKDTIEKLKRIQKLAKQLRGELNP
ncbi:MAG TPA: hypothetical protein VND65_11030 [Candidatus Binatia bacterium]|nr:hypothetical protein [Candidatus Binatia bacterium]